MKKEQKKNPSKKGNIQRMIAIVLLIAMVAMYLSSLFMYS